MEMYKIARQESDMYRKLLEYNKTKGYLVDTYILSEFKRKMLKLTSTVYPYSSIQ
jgi:hypothetical protein